MIARGIHDFTTLTTAGAAAGKYSTTIKQQRRRLEAILFQIAYTSGGAATTPTSESFGRILKRVRVKVNDVAGSRFLADVEGVAILDEFQQMGGCLPWPTAYAYGNSGSAATTCQLLYPLFLRHPQLQEPGGNLTSVPLYDLREDLNVEVELGANTDVAASGVTLSSVTVRMAPIFRDTVGGEYIPSEILSSDRDSLASSSRVEIELPSNGLLTSVLVQAYAATNKNARQSITTAGENDVSLYYGRDQVRKLHPLLAQDFSCLSSPQPPTCTTTVNGVANLSHSFLIDLLDDLPLADAFSAGSALNLTSIRAGGDTARLVVSLTNATAPCVRLTSRKFLGGPIDKLILA